MNNIAFGFFGQTRVSDVINVWYKKIEKDYDFFMSTWNDNESEKLNFEFTKINKHNFEEENPKIQKDIPNECFDKYTNSMTNIYKDKEAGYILFHTANIIKTIKEYEKENNFKYDVIVLCRPDHVVNLEQLKLQINTFLKQSDFDRPMISIQTPMMLNNRTFSIAEDAVFILNNQALDHMLNLKKELFDDRLDLEIKFGYRGAHELIPFMIVKHNFLSVVSGIQSKVIRTKFQFEEYLRG